MALTTFQKHFMTKITLYQNMRNLIQALDSVMDRVGNDNEILLKISSQDLVDIGVPLDTQTLLSNVRTGLTELLDFYYGNGNTQTQVMGDLADNVRI